MENKYSSHGYIKLWIPGSSNEQNLKVIRETISHPDALRDTFERLWKGLQTEAGPAPKG